MFNARRHISLQCIPNLFYVLIWYWEYYWCCCVFLQLFICDTKWHAGVMHYRP